ncbi:MAG: ABC transporter permease [Gemmatimonadota bacterium]|jgi:predicted permease
MPDWYRYLKENLPRDQFRGELEQEILEELAGHLDDAFTEALSRGAAPEEAEARVVAEIQDWEAFARNILRTRKGAQPHRAADAMERSEVRIRRRGGRWVSVADALQELRLTLRRLAKAPGFSLVAVLTLAIGIGATTAIFSVVKDVLLDPLPYEDAHELVWVGNAAPGMGADLNFQSLAFNAMYTDEAQSLEHTGVWTTSTTTVMGTEGPQELSDVLMTEGVLQALEVQPVLGRAFTFEDTQTGSPFTILLSHRYWVDRFDADPNVLGQTLTVGETPREIIGVMPEGFRLMDQDPPFYRPLRYDKATLDVSNFSYFGVGRLTDGFTIEEALPELNRLAYLAPERYPGMVTAELLEQVEGRAVLRPLRDEVVGNVGNILWVVLGGVGIILLVAAANVANLLLVRADSRERAVAIQAALGSSRVRVVGQSLLESGVLAVSGGVLGLGLAYAGLEFLKAVGPGNLPRLHEVGLDPGVVLFAMGISLVTGVALGFMPSIRLWRTNLVGALKEGGRGFAAGRSRNRARNALVVGQTALALVLLVGSGLMIRSFLSLSRVNPGFTQPEEILTFRLGLTSQEVPDLQEVPVAHQQMAQRLEEIPGVTSVGLSTSVPMDGRAGFDPIFFEDFPLAPGQSPQLRSFKWLGGDYHETMGNPVLAGRAMSWDDIHSRARVVVITESLAREVFDNPARAVGRRLSTGLEPGDWREIIGVVGDVRDEGVEMPVTDLVYWPMALEGYFGAEFFIHRNMTYAVRSPRVGSPDFLAEVRNAVWSLYPTRPLGGMVTMDLRQRDSMARTSFTLVMLAIAAAVALLLGSIGIFGVISYTVSQRTQELGLRKAMGAEAGRVTGLVVRQGLVLAVAGVVAGIVAAVAVTRLMASILFGVDPVDPLTYVTVSAVLMGVALLASYLPARRAARVDPMVALRAE